jgi:hypothetical protein
VDQGSRLTLSEQNEQNDKRMINLFMDDSSLEINIKGQPSLHVLL